MRRFVTCTASGTAARSTVEALTFRAVTRTLLFDQPRAGHASKPPGMICLQVSDLME